MNWIKIVKVAKFIWEHRAVIVSWLDFLSVLIQLLRKKERENMMESVFTQNVYARRNMAYCGDADLAIARIEYLAAVLSDDPELEKAKRQRMDELSDGRGI